jgi:heme/copper-type cytochrome/quinol oxidase subunit 2
MMMKLILLGVFVLLALIVASVNLRAAGRAQEEQTPWTRYFLLTTNIWAAAALVIGAQILGSIQ